MPKELLNVMEDWKGYTAVSEARKSTDPDYERKLQEVAALVYNTNGLASHRWEFLMREALSTSDFPLLFGDVLDRQVLAAYKGVPAVWKKFTRPSTVRRIYPQIGGYRFAITGGDQYLDNVPEKGEYPASGRTEKQYAVYVKKYGRQFDISWEAIINDDLGALKDTPQRFALAAARTEHRLVTASYCDDVGTHAAGNLYENGSNEDVLALDIANLQTCVQRMQAFTDENGEPIMNRPATLVVGPALEFTARAILTSATKMWVDVQGGAGAAVVPLPTTNVIPQIGLELVVDPYIPILHADAPGSWFLFANPADIAAIEADTLQGHERPEICMKDSNKVSVGGGSISALDGDFESDNVLYRVRDVFGANKLDWRATYANIHA